MKTKIITIALVAISCVSSHLVAQEVASKSARYDLKKNVKCRIIPTETGFSIAFEYNEKSPIDATVNQSSGKKGYDYYSNVSEYSVSSSDNSVTEVKSPRDAASGMATGKRQHKPLTITKQMDKSSPAINNSVSSTGTTEGEATERGTGGGSGKVSMQDLSISKRCAGNTTVLSVLDGECVIPTADCPNGFCNLKITWTWNDASVSTELGSGVTRKSNSSIDFSLKIEDGVCTAMAINEKGLPGDKPRKTKAKN